MKKIMTASKLYT